MQGGLINMRSIQFQSSRKRRITRIGTHVFFPGTHDFRLAGVPRTHVF